MAKLYFYYSAMNAGKSTTLLQSSHNYNERGMDTLLYVPKIDNRYGEGLITTRIGLQKKAQILDQDDNVFLDVQSRLTKNNNIKCVLVDEAQFLSKAQSKQLCDITDYLNIPVLAYGIRSDFQGEPFEGSLYLMTWADHLVELKTVCHCGKKALMNMRIDSHGKPIKTGKQIDIGGNERYISTCRKHFKLALKTKSVNIETATLVEK